MRALALLLLLPLVSCASRINFEQFQQRIDAAGVWSGGPEVHFERVGRMTLATAIEYGLMPDHKVLDVGAGSLRVGWWFLNYIEPSNYHAIEPNHEMINTAAKIIGEKINVYYNTDREFPDVEFDFVIARSIWTHASKPMIAKMLSEFAENSSLRGRFLTSFHPAESADQDYMGQEWVGKSHESDKGGMVKHSLKWIEDECDKNGLTVQVGDKLRQQTWLIIAKK